MKTIPLAELAEINPSVRLTKGAQYPFVAMEVVAPGRRYVHSETDRRYSGGGSRFQSGDTLFARITPCLENGKVGQFVLTSNALAFGSTEFIVFRARDGISDPGYLYYLCSSSLVRDPAIKSMTGASGRQRVQLDVIANTSVPLLPLDVQRKVSAILSGYDDLIETNLRRIAILEETVRATYREWFVEFRYPGNEGATLVEPQHSPIPEGWLVVDAASVIERLKPETTYTETDVVSRGSVPVVDQSARELLGFHDGEPDFTATPARPLMVFGDHTCRMKLLMEPFSVGPNVVPFTVSTALPALYAFYSLQDRVETREYKRHWNDLMRLKVVIPERSLVDGFCGTATPMVSLAGELSRENLVLKDMRDLVLPKLVSGEIDVETICQDRRIAN